MIGGFKPRLLSSTAAIAGALLVATYGHAEVDITPRVQALATFTDNVNLDRRGRQADVVLRASPGVNITSLSRRFTTSVDYSANTFVFLGNIDNTDLRHSLNGTATAELLRDFLFFNADAAIGQRFADLTGPVSSSQANFSNNRRSIRTFNVSPVIRQEIGIFATAQAAYRFNYLDVSQDDRPGSLVRDSTGHRGEAALASGPKFTRFGWSLTGSYEYIDREGFDEPFEEYLAFANVNYAFNRQLTLLGSVGYEDVSDPTLRRTIDGEIWNVGARVSPGPRTTLEVRGGERFGEPVFSGALSYRLTETSTLSAEYAEDIQTFNRLVANELAEVVAIIDGIPVDENGIPVIVDDSDFSFTPAAFFSKRFTLGLHTERRDTTYRLRVHYAERTFDDLVRSETDTVSVRATYERSLGRGQFATADLNFRRNDRSGGRNTNFISGSVSYRKSFSDHFDALASVQHSTSANSGGGRDFSSSSITVGVRGTF